MEEHAEFGHKLPQGLGYRRSGVAAAREPLRGLVPALKGWGCGRRLATWSLMVKPWL